ncbi:MAG: hypothetical protein ABI651_09240 [Verrucomicrobiota bacterium]
MWRIVLLSVVLMSGGCAFRPPHERQLSLGHQVSVPPMWTSGRATPGPPGDNDLQRYVDAYERGWWTVVQEYVKSIDYYRPPLDLRTSSGWPAATYGWERGVGDASIRIKRLIDAFGKQKVSAYLSEFKDSVWFEP